VNGNPIGIPNCALRCLGAVLAFALLIGSLPTTTGVTVVGAPDRPTLSLDLCHPLEAAAVGAIGIFARPAPIDFKPHLPAFVLRILERTLFPCRLPDTPACPPPETRA